MGAMGGATGTTYRADIDGLRAVAVVSVLVFHAFPELLPGGFVGVDVFFVISGYLITTILLGELLQARFSVLRFYERRIRRIVPALLLVLSITFVAGWALLFSDELKGMSGYFLSGVLSAGNLRNLMGGGYFDSASDLTPLLHLWSLGIEEQFYLVWPLVLTLGVGKSLSLRRLGVWIACSLVASFLLGIWLTPQHRSAAFYLPFSRYWELAAGGLLALLNRARAPGLSVWIANLLAAAGGLALGTAVLVIDGTRPFPGFWALLPVLGAVSLIAAGPHAWLSRELLSARPMVGIGLISYPLYLWHWPLLSLARVSTPR